jgi:hypothetical protein
MFPIAGMRAIGEVSTSLAPHCAFSGFAPSRRVHTTQKTARQVLQQ